MIVAYRVQTLPTSQEEAQKLFAFAKALNIPSIVVDTAPHGRIGHFLRSPRFQPDHRRPQDWGTWWSLPPRLVQEYLAILGFTDATISWHRQLFLGRKRWLYTVVARKKSQP